MRVRLIFKNKEKGATVPFHHQYYLFRFFKGLIKKSGKDEFNNFNHYNFSGLKGQTTVSKSGLHFYSSKITVVFSCSNQDFIDSIIEVLFTLPEIKLNGLSIIPHSVELENEIEFAEETKYICISPLILLTPEFSSDEGKKFMHPESGEFVEQLRKALLEKNELNDFGGFEFHPDQNYLKKLEDRGKKYSRVYPIFDQDIPYEVRGYTFPFTLQASPELHKYLFECGLGLFNDKGFGMLDLAEVTPGSKTVPYFTGQLSN
ncbi:CRISPR-associated endoribonuclease Cas6 [Marivirga sericea]|uniref:CRISPR-associated endoribonuclease Cas6 n=1 Tax=Marivirga sericea TaxID=1028 RepID=A0A1X7L2S3_9BACT|nr:CRISPR-associated endoribonuclease Cas6 [Marivirga sericea]SMG47389.1 CRISPR-associated endoribonuclease Cas6 [Marivirga sericea]